jgi:hypothetical protein
MDFMAKFIVDAGLIPSLLRRPLPCDDETVVYTFGCALHPFPLHPMIPSRSTYVFFDYDFRTWLFRLASHFKTLTHRFLQHLTLCYKCLRKKG